MTQTNHPNPSSHPEQTQESAFLSAVLDTVDALIVVLDTAGQIVRFNHKCEQATGYQFAEVQGKRFADLFLLPEEAPAVAKVVEALMTGHYPNRHENHWMTKAGSRRLIQWSNTVLKDGAGEIIYIVATGIDVTDHRQTEAKFHESELVRQEANDRYSNLFNNHHVPMLLIEPETGQIVEANPAACEFYGWEPAVLTRMKISEINTLPMAQVKDQMAQAQSTATGHQFIFQHRLASGETRDVEVHSGPILLNRKKYLFSIIHDVTERKRMENELRWLSVLPLESPNPAIRISPDGVLLFANPASTAILQDWDVQVGQTLPRPWQQRVQNTFSSGLPQDFEITSADRQIFSCVLIPMVSEGYLNLYGRNVTREKQAELEQKRLLHELEAERARWQAAVEHMLDPVTVCDAEGHATFMNSAYTRLVHRQIMPGVALEAHAQAYQLYHPDGTLFNPKDLPLQKAALENIELHDIEIVQAAPDGARVDVVWNAAPMHDHQGRAIGAVAVGRDVTQQRRAEREREQYFQELAAITEKHAEARREAERRADELAAVFNAMTEGVAIYDATEKFIRVNPALVVAYGFDPTGLDRFAVAPKLAAHHPNGQPILPEEMVSAKALRGETVQGFPFIFNNGEREMQILASGAPILIDGRPVGAVAVWHDVTALRKTEQSLAQHASELERINAELRDFVFIASHDLQEPLRKITVFGNLIKSTKGDACLSEQSREYLDRMQKAADRMRHMIDDLLSYSRVNSKASTFETVDVQQIAEEVVSDLEGSLLMTNGKVVLGSLPVLRADQLQIRQLLQNLIGNALKFHKPEAPPVVNVYARDLPNREVEIVVQDNGIGFNEAYLERIFQPFQRLNGRSEYEGNGIGLAICRKIAERHSGTITARSQPGEGSTFIVRLPNRMG